VGSTESTSGRHAAPTPGSTWAHWRSSLTHLRIKNTLHVAPVVLFAISQAHALDVRQAFLTVCILHLLIFPASVGYNTYYDRDEKPTGGLEAPPPVHESLYWLATGLELLALGLAFLVSLPFVVCIVVTILASRAYSYDKIRIKGRPIAGYVWVALFQGGFSYVMVAIGIAPDPSVVTTSLLTPEYVLPALFSTFLVAGSYPLSQIYQFEEDGARGDTTIAMLAGYNGTFILCQVMLTVGYACIASYLLLYKTPLHLVVLTVLFLFPGAYVAHWWKKVREDVRNADHTRAMNMFKLSGVTGNLAFILLFAIDRFFV
jgi:4-hydroxybenzoate polyprenyltransferase